MQIDSFNCTILMDVVEKKQLGFFLTMQSILNYACKQQNRNQSRSYLYI